MEYQKIINLLYTTSDNVPRFNTKMWIEVYDQSRGIYNINKQMRFKTSMLQSDLCDYSDAYNIFERTITVTGPNDENYKKGLASKNNAPFISCLSKINNMLIDNAEDCNTYAQFD